MADGKRAAWTLEDLRADLQRWEQELTTMGYPQTTIRTHIDHSAQFIRWLAGEWQPQGPRRRA